MLTSFHWVFIVVQIDCVSGWIEDNLSFKTAEWARIIHFKTKRLWTLNSHTLTVSFSNCHISKHDLLSLKKLDLQVDLWNVSGCKLCDKKCLGRQLRLLCLRSSKEEHILFLFFLVCFYVCLGFFPWNNIHLSRTL